MTTPVMCVRCDRCDGRWGWTWGRAAWFWEIKQRLSGHRPPYQYTVHRDGECDHERCECEVTGG